MVLSYVSCGVRQTRIGWVYGSEFAKCGLIILITLSLYLQTFHNLVVISISSSRGHGKYSNFGISFFLGGRET